MEARATVARNTARITTREASLILMFGEVPVAVERLAMCVHTHRRIGASHALLHLRRLVAACLRHHLTNDSTPGTEARRLAMTLAQPLKELDDALAADRLLPNMVGESLLRLSLVGFRLWQLEQLLVYGPRVKATT